jgi:sn-glycerol 3-phosphate transport system substrate-binding protein
MKLDPWVLETVLTGAEQEMVNEDNGRAGLASASTIDGDANTEFLDWLAGMTADGLLKAVPYGDSLDDFMAIANGSSTFTISGTRSISSVAAVMDGQDSGLSGSNAEAEAALARLDLRAGLFPGLDAPGRSGVSGTAAYVVDGPDEQVAATWDFVKYFSQTPQQVRWAIDGSYLPVSEEVLTDPALVEAATTTRSGKWTATVMAGLSELDADFPGPLVGPYAENREVLIGLLEAVAGGEPIDRQVDDATARITGYLEDYRAEVGG